MIYSYAPIDQMKPLGADAQGNLLYGRRYWCDEGSLIMLKQWLDKNASAYGVPTPLPRMMLDAGGMVMMNELEVTVEVGGDKYTVVARHADLFMAHLDNRHVMMGTAHCRLRCPWSVIVLTAETAQKLKDALTAKLPEIEALAIAANNKISESLRDIQAKGGRVISENVKPPVERAP